MARYLVDTHLLLWAAADSAKLGDRATAVLSDPANVVSFSAASVWEVMIKAALGRPGFVIDVDRFAARLSAAGYQEIPVTARHAARVRTLPAVHRDPFDRLLVAQALVEDLSLLTHDSRIGGYPGSIELV